MTVKKAAAAAAATAAVHVHRIFVCRSLGLSILSFVMTVKKAAAAAAAAGAAVAAAAAKDHVHRICVLHAHRMFLRIGWLR